MTIAYRLSNFFFLRWTQEYRSNSNLFKFLVYGLIIIILLFWYLAIPILLNIYLGIIITRKKLFHKLFSFFNRQHIILKIFYYAVFMFIMFMLFIMVFTWFIFIFLYVGSLFEKNKFRWKQKKKEKEKSLFKKRIEGKDRYNRNKVNLPLKKELDKK